MDENKQHDLFCNQCLLQFGKKYVFDLHLSLVHGKKLVIKNEASEVSSFQDNHSKEIDDMQGGVQQPMSKKVRIVHTTAK